MLDPSLSIAFSSPLEVDARRSLRDRPREINSRHLARKRFSTVVVVRRGPEIIERQDPDTELTIDGRENPAMLTGLELPRESDLNFTGDRQDGSGDEVAQRVRQVRGSELGTLIQVRDCRGRPAGSDELIVEMHPSKYGNHLRREIRIERNLRYTSRRSNPLVRG